MLAVNSVPALRAAFGAFERVFYVAAFAWLLAAATIVLGH
jgi:hypothetical protein